MTKNWNRTIAEAYAKKLLEVAAEYNQKSSAKAKPIDKHGNYDGTDVGFTSDSIQNPSPKSKVNRRKKRPNQRHGNYAGTDAGFTSDIND